MIFGTSAYSFVKAIKYIPVSNEVIHTKNARVYSNDIDYYNVQYGRDEKA